MPKKTKRQKIIAQYRKKIKLLETSFIPSAISTPKPIDTPSPDKVINKEKPITTEKVKDLEIDKGNLLKGFFMSDFKKSLILSLAIIALEIIFYFATIKNYLKLE